jgi:hypothetical protein
VNAALTQRLHLLRRAHVAQRDANAWMTRAERAKDIDEDRRVGRAGHRHDHLTEFTHTLRDVRGVIGLGENHPGFGDEHPARLGELDLPLGAMKEFDAELLFELPDLLTERRLADMKTLRRLSEVQAVGDGDGVAEMTEFHSAHMRNVLIATKDIFHSRNKA